MQCAYFRNNWAAWLDLTSVALNCVQRPLCGSGAKPLDSGAAKLPRIYLNIWEAVRGPLLWNTSLIFCYWHALLLMVDTAKYFCLFSNLLKWEMTIRWGAGQWGNKKTTISATCQLHLQFAPTVSKETHSPVHQSINNDQCTVVNSASRFCLSWPNH